MNIRNVAVLFIAVAALVVAVVPGAAQEGPIPIPLDNPAAPFIETYHYAVNAGATAEFRKMEGLAIDEANGFVYVAMSEINKGMSDTEGAIQLPENDCGIVYQGAYDEDMNISNWKPYIVGGPYDEEADPANECSVEAIANPDGLEVDGMGRVWVGEDTGNHNNNMLWVCTADECKRFATVPEGAEVTGARITDSGDIFFNVQHPSATAKYPYNRGVVGVVVGFNANTDDFESVPVPEGDAKLDVVVAAGEYQVLARVGDALPNAPYGELFGELIRPDGSTLGFCNDPDGNMWLPITETEGYLYSNVECTPGGVSKLYIRKGTDGWDVLDGEMVDFSGVRGTWNNCNASMTTWNTALTSEEYPSETNDDWALSSRGGAMADYLGGPANPYDYGYIVELQPAVGVGTKVTKLYAMGRFSMEQTLIMPDGKTAYYGDDGTNRIFFKFVADEVGDLSVGTLYAGVATQLEDESFDIEWIELGWGDSFDIYDAIRELDPLFE